MPNISPMGAFAEGIAGGIQGGMQNYVQLMLQKIDKKEKKDIATANMAFKLYTDKNLPREIRKQAYKTWGQVNKEWNTGIQAPNIPDEYWENPELSKYFQRSIAIMKNDDYSTQDKMKFLQGIEVEAIDAMGMGASQVLQPLQKELKQEKISGLFQPTDQKPSPFVSGLQETYTPEQVSGMGAATGAGMPLTEATKLFPQRKAAPGRAPSEYEIYSKIGAKEFAKYKAAGRKEDVHYPKIGGNLYKVVGGEATLIQKGSLEDKAYYNAMRDPERIYVTNEQELCELIQKHERVLRKEPRETPPALPIPEEPSLLDKIKGRLGIKEGETPSVSPTPKRYKIPKEKEKEKKKITKEIAQSILNEVMAENRNLTIEQAKKEARKRAEERNYILH